MTWSLNGRPLPPNAVAVRYPRSSLNWLRITNVQLENVGTYICSSIGIDGSPVLYGGELIVTGKKLVWYIIKEVYLTASNVIMLVTTFTFTKLLSVSFHFVWSSFSLIMKHYNP